MRRCAVGAGSLAELAQRCPPARFPALRSGIGALAAGGGVSAPWQVYKEIERKGDELFKWARENREMFEKGGDEVVDLAAKLMKKHKKMGNRNANVERADAYVVAQAVAWPQAGSAWSRSQ